ncbi:hypothetical protein HRbin25_00063 [bacterium HR25]|jgi:1-acyl-sn-glycerol-3-phosphate acyltransferase|nr:hypothetical protein HRbin25_00063 [bacterium HR25]
MEASAQRAYRLPYSYIARFALAVLSGRKRDVGQDAGAVLASVRLPTRIVGEEHIPASGPFVLIANHYDRPGLRVFWGGMLLTWAVWRRRGDAPRWLMTSEWYNFRLGPVPVPPAVLRWVFRRLARVYSLVIVPRPQERAAGRAAAMRAIMEVVRKDGQPIALFPEGTGHGTLILPPEGVGALLLGLSERGVPTLPAGLYEEGGTLVARFGPPLLVQATAQDREERYRQARDEAMMAIGRLLPRALWGVYALDLERALERGQHMA